MGNISVPWKTVKRHPEQSFAKKDEKFWEGEIMKLPEKWQKVVEQKSFPGGSGVKNPPANAGDEGLIPGLGRFSREGKGNPLQYPCLGNHMDRGSWQARIHGGCKKFGHNLATKQQQSGINQ